MCAPGAGAGTSARRRSSRRDPGGGAPPRLAHRPERGACPHRQPEAVADEAGRARRREHQAAEERPDELLVPVEAPVARTTAPSSGSSVTRVSVGAPPLRRACAEQAPEQRLAGGQRARGVAARKLVVVRAAREQLGVRDRPGPVRRVADEVADPLGRVVGGRLERAPALARPVELGVVVGIGIACQRSGVSRSSQAAVALASREDLHQLVDDVAEGERAQVRERLLGRVVGPVVRRQPRDAAGQRGRAADPLAALEDADVGARLRGGQRRGEAGRAGTDDGDPRHAALPASSPSRYAWSAVRGATASPATGSLRPARSTAPARAVSARPWTPATTASKGRRLTSLVWTCRVTASPPCTPPKSVLGSRAHPSRWRRWSVREVRRRRRTARR